MVVHTTDWLSFADLAPASASAADRDAVGTALCLVQCLAASVAGIDEFVYHTTITGGGGSGSGPGLEADADVASGDVLATRYARASAAWWSLTAAAGSAGWTWTQLPHVCAALHW